jgi:tyrosine aminotransferase
MSPSGVRTQWEVVSSNTAQNTHNPIRDIVENLRLEPNPEKPMIALSIGEFLDTIYIR